MNVCNLIKKRNSMYTWIMPLYFESVPNIITLHTTYDEQTGRQPPHPTDKAYFLEYAPQFNNQPFFVTTDSTHVPFYQDGIAKRNYENMVSMDYEGGTGSLYIPIQDYMDFLQMVESWRTYSQGFMQFTRMSTSQKVAQTYTSGYSYPGCSAWIYGHVKSTGNYELFGTHAPTRYDHNYYDSSTRIAETKQERYGSWFLKDSDRNSLLANDIDELWVGLDFPTRGRTTTTWPNTTGPFTAYADWYSFDKIECILYR